MREQARANRYRQLFAKLGDDEAHHLADKLQVLALTHPDMLREFEGFIGREGGETTSETHMVESSKSEAGSSKSEVGSSKSEVGSSKVG
jgi:hypothetical protein